MSSKSYRAPPLSNDEKLVIDAFERFFTFEFYVRYLKKYRGNDLYKIQLIKSLITKRFEDLDTVNELSQFEIAFSGHPENLYSIDIGLHDLVNWTLNGLQRSALSLSGLDSTLICSDINFKKWAKDHLGIPYNEYKKYINPRQKNLAYRFSELTNPNDINCVFNWWCEHANCKSNASKSTVRNIGLVHNERVLKDDDSYSFITRLDPLPFSAPSVIFFKQDEYSIHSSNSDTITINGQDVSNSVVFIVRFDRDLQGFQVGLDRFMTTLRSQHSTWYLNNLKPRVIPDFKVAELDSFKSSTFNLSDKYARIIERTDSITKNLIGLICFDEVEHSVTESEKKQKRNKHTLNAADEVSHRIAKYITTDAKRIQDNYLDVAVMIDQIHDVIECKRKKVKYGEMYKFKKTEE